MRMEQRGCVIRSVLRVNLYGEEPVSSTKPFEISKRFVWNAYLDVKRSGGGPGVDGQTMEDFEYDLKNQLYKIWNRMSSGTYFPPPVLRVEIPKADGGIRELGIPTVTDRIAQAVVKRCLETIVEPFFHDDSYGYRPGRSAVDAVASARQRCWHDNWVLDLDIKQFFDRLNHCLVMRAVRRYTNCTWVLLYIERWLRVDVQSVDGTRQSRDQGTPQGGAISPLLANLFLHLAFDQWMKENYPCIHFERYADDIVVHCRSDKQAEWIKGKIEQRLHRCLLELHPAKTKIVYCKDSRRQGKSAHYSFDFLGYTFRPRSARNYRGEFFVSFSPAISRTAAKRLRQMIRRSWKLTTRTHLDMREVARRLNPVISAWINYYGRFCRSALHPVLDHINSALIAWAMCKFKRLRRRKTRAANWLKGVARREPSLFAHWSYQGWMTRAV
jgi:RNA-directed DNA polymerase